MHGSVNSLCATPSRSSDPLFITMLLFSKQNIKPSIDLSLIPSNKIMTIHTKYIIQTYATHSGPIQSAFKQSSTLCVFCSNIRAF